MVSNDLRILNQTANFGTVYQGYPHKGGETVKQRADKQGEGFIVCNAAVHNMVVDVTVAIKHVNLRFQLKYINKWPYEFCSECSCGNSQGGKGKAEPTGVRSREGAKKVIFGQFPVDIMDNPFTMSSLLTNNKPVQWPFCRTTEVSRIQCTIKDIVHCHHPPLLNGRCTSLLRPPPVSEMTYTVSSGTLNPSTPYTITVTINIDMQTQ